MSSTLKQTVERLQLDQNDKLIIFVTFPMMKTKKIQIRSSNPISVVFQLFPKGDKTVFYRGGIIEHSESFSNFGMSDNDRIVIVPTENLDFKNELFWRNATKIDTETKQKIQILQDPLLRDQFSRQQDLQMLRTENRSVYFRETVKNFQTWKRIQPNDHFPTFLNFSSNTKPSEDSLPVLW
jgi:hypothetical protein